MAERDIRKLKDTIREAAEGFGYECVGVDIDAARGSGTTIRIFIDVTGGVTHEACERVSRSVGEYLDGCEEGGEPWFDGKYYIEVSSPGVERPLFTPEHYRRFVGNPVAIHTKAKKRISGTIESLDVHNNVTIAMNDGSMLKIPFEEIRRAHLVFKFEKGEKKPANAPKGRTNKKKPK